MSRGQVGMTALLGLLLCVPILKAALMYSAGLELHFDEAQYWEWSQQLDWGYYSKGPLVAWLIALSEALFGHGVWQVRLPAGLVYSGFLALLFFFARQVWRSNAAAWWALLLGLTTPLYFGLGAVMTTDVLLLPLWAWALWAAYRALFRAQRLAWYEFGAAVGLGCLTKLSIILLPVFLVIWWLLTHHGWAPLRNPHLWGAVLLALLLISPLVLWNANHDWVMLRHDLGHVSHGQWSITRALEFLLGQIIILSPLVVIVAASVLIRKPAAADQGFLWITSLFLVGFFLIKALGAKVQLNWPAASYIGWLILFAGHIPSMVGVKRYALYLGLGISVMWIALSHFPYTFGLSNTLDPFHKMRAWEEPVELLSASVAEGGQAIEFILADSYPLAAELAFYWPEQPINVYITGESTRRFNQHDLWPGIEREASQRGLYVSHERQPPDIVQRAFTRCTELTPVPARAPDGALLRTLYASICEDYRPISWPRPSRY